MKDLRFIKHPADTLYNNQFALFVQKEGYKGYGIYPALMENFFGQPGYQSPLKTIGLLATRLGIKKTVLLRLITEYGLFQLTETHFAASQLATTRQRNTRPCCQPQTPETATTQEQQQTQEKQTRTNLPKSIDKETANEQTKSVQRNNLPSNMLIINKTSNRQEKTRKEKEKNILTHYNARA